MSNQGTPSTPSDDKIVMLSEQQNLEQLKKEDFMYDNAKLAKFLEENAAKYPKQKVSFTSIIFQFVKQVKIGADVTRISMPTYFLKPESHLGTFCALLIFVI